MKLIATLSLLAVLSSASFGSQSPPKDLLGWEGSRWGMTSPELAKVFGARAQRTPDIELYGDAYYEYTVPDVSLKARMYTAILVMDSSGKLKRVDVRLNEYESPAPRDDVFDALASMLTDQYGPAAETKDDRRSEAVDRRRKWKLPTTTVELACYWSYGGQSSNVLISYYPTKANPVDPKTPQ